MALQPIYHRATILFTGKGESLTSAELEAKLREALGAKYTDVIVEEFEEPEYGDPTDL